MKQIRLFFFHCIVMYGSSVHIRNHPSNLELSIGLRMRWCNSGVWLNGCGYSERIQEFMAAPRRDALHVIEELDVFSKGREF